MTFFPLTPKSAHWKVNIIYLTEEVHVQVNPREGLERDLVMSWRGNEHFFAQVGSLVPPLALTALCCVGIKEKPWVGCKQHLFPQCGFSMLPQQCKSLYCWSVPENQQQKHTNPSKGTATLASSIRASHTRRTLFHSLKQNKISLEKHFHLWADLSIMCIQSTPQRVTSKPSSKPASWPYKQQGSSQRCWHSWSTQTWACLDTWRRLADRQTCLTGCPQTTPVDTRRAADTCCYG